MRPAPASAIATALPAVVDRPDDLGARGAMLEGACLAGRCLHNASMGVHHGLAQLVGGRTGLPHGLANAVLLAHSIRFNEPAVPAEVARVGAALGDAADAAGAVDRLRSALGLPASLSELGVDEAELEVVARLSQGHRTIAGNPRPVSEDDALAILQAAWSPGGG